MSFLSIYTVFKQVQEYAFGLITLHWPAIRPTKTKAKFKYMKLHVFSFFFLFFSEIKVTKYHSKYSKKDTFDSVDKHCCSKYIYIYTQTYFKLCFQFICAIIVGSFYNTLLVKNSYLPT